MKIDHPFGIDVTQGEGRNLQRSTARYQRPTKEAVRAWLTRVVSSGEPPPSSDEIVNELWPKISSGDDGGKS